MNRTILFFALITITFRLTAQTYKEGNIYYDKNKWVEFIPGNMPLVISVPHGGLINLTDVPDRTCPDAITVIDTHTQDLAKAIDSVFRRDYHFHPSIILCTLRRLKVDMNREIELGTCGNELMRTPWMQWHDWVDTALAMAVKQYGQSAYIDLHAQGHPEQRLELGYLLTPKELEESSKGDNDTAYTYKASIKNLIAANKGKLTLKELLTGPNAFGTWMVESGFPSVPSKQDPYAFSNQKYFNGGYNTARYARYPNVFGWQIETNSKGVRDTPEAYYRFAEAFVKNIMRYIATYTSIDVKKIGK